MSKGEQENKWACPYNNEECEKCHLCTECITKEKEQEKYKCSWCNDTKILNYPECSIECFHCKDKEVDEK